VYAPECCNEGNAIDIETRRDTRLSHASESMDQAPRTKDRVNVGMGNVGQGKVT